MIALMNPFRNVLSVARSSYVPAELAALDDHSLLDIGLRPRAVPAKAQAESNLRGSAAACNLGWFLGAGSLFVLLVAVSASPASARGFRAWGGDRSRDTRQVHFQVPPGYNTNPMMHPYTSGLGPCTEGYSPGCHAAASHYKVK